ncbi:hypothetical protein H5410_042191 [Solanum commersonii]|uniref:Uncharacterized protein n=1 Tax=Solanum commersonii TaxID=4109 RepID=A0A9J5XV10_SOLCO|nr:hypothetical protein H5410_042191 [Solanum commersonii]
MESFGPDGQTGPFPSFGDSEFRSDCYKKISRTSVKTLAIEPVGRDGSIKIFVIELVDINSPWILGDPEF